MFLYIHKHQAATATASMLVALAAEANSLLVELYTFRKHFCLIANSDAFLLFC